jgi:hypothetical protein
MLNLTIVHFLRFFIQALRKENYKKYLLDDVRMLRYGTDYVRTLAMYVCGIYLCKYVSFDTESGFMACFENWDTFCKCDF